MQQDSLKKMQRESNKLAGLFLISVVIYLLLSVCLNILSTKGIELPSHLLLVISEALIIVPGIIFILINNLNLRKDLGFNKIKVGTIFMSILLAFVSMPIASFINVLTQFFVSNTMIDASETLLDGSYIVLIFLSGFYGPFCEEFVFRGILARGYDKISTPIKAIMASSLLFGFMHLNLNQACYAFVLGILFAVVNKASGSIYTSMIVHTVINTFNMLMLIVVDLAYSAIGGNLVEATNDARTSGDVLYVTAGIYLVLAIICIAICVPIIVFIAKHEGHFEELKSVFSSKQKRSDSAESEFEECTEECVKSSVKVFTSAVMIVSIVVCVFLIFAMEPLMNALGL